MSLNETQENGIETLDTITSHYNVVSYNLLLGSEWLK